MSGAIPVAQSRTSYLSGLQESDSIQASLEIGYLIVQPSFPPLGVDFHELIFAVSKISSEIALTSVSETNIRYHFLKTLHCLVHFCPRRDIVLNLVHKRGVGYAAGIGGCVLSATGLAASSDERNATRLRPTHLSCQPCPSSLASPSMRAKAKRFWWKLFAVKFTARKRR